MFQHVIAFQGSLKCQTVAIAAGDVNTKLTTLIDAALVAAGSTAVDDWSRIKTVFLTCETNDARFLFGAAATATQGHILAVGTSWLISHQSMIQNANIINKTAGNNASIMATLGY